MRSTHTYAGMEISDAAYNEILEKLRAAGYDHAILEDGALDMHGIGLVRRTNEDAQLKAMETQYDFCDCKLGDCIRHYRQCRVDTRNK